MITFEELRKMERQLSDAVEENAQLRELSRSQAAALEIFREALADISGITYDHDGFTSAEELGKLLDEMHTIAMLAARKVIEL